MDTEVGISSKKYTADPKFNLDKLASNPKTRSLTRGEIQRREITWLDAKSAVRDYISGIIEGHNEIRGMIDVELKAAIVRVCESINRYRESDPIASDATHVHAYAEDQTRVDEVYLGEDIIEDLKRLMNLQRSAAGFSSKFVSTEIIRQHPNYPSSTH